MSTPASAPALAARQAAPIGNRGKQIMINSIADIKRRMVELGHEFRETAETAETAGASEVADYELDEIKMRELTEVVSAREGVQVKLLEWKLIATASIKRILEQHPELGGNCESDDETDSSPELKIALMQLAADRVVLEALEYCLGAIRRGAGLAPRCLTVCQAIKDMAARLAEQSLAPLQPTGPPAVTELDLLKVRLQLESFLIDSYFPRDAIKIHDLADSVEDTFESLMEARDELYPAGPQGPPATGAAGEESA